MLVLPGAGRYGRTCRSQLLLFVPKIQPESSFHHQPCSLLPIFYSSADLPNQWVLGTGAQNKVRCLTLRHVNFHTGLHLHVRAMLNLAVLILYSNN